MPQAESVAMPKRLPLVIQPENRDETSLKDAKLINAYVEKNELTEDYWIFKRPGLAQTGATLSGDGLGVYNWLGDVYAIFGSVLYKNGVSVGTGLNTAGGGYRFSQTLGTTPRLQLGNGAATYNYTVAGGVVEIISLTTVTAGSFVVGVSYTILVPGTTDFTLIGAANNNVGTVFTATGVGAGTGTATTANNFPTNAVKGIEYLDGTTYVLSATADVHGCKTLNDPTDWTDVLNIVQAQIEADGGVALAKQLVYIVALGEWSTEVFYDAQNPVASPLAPVQGAKLSHGCASADSVQSLDGILFWLATNRSAAYQIVLVDNLRLSVISTKAIDRLLGEADLSVVHSFALKYEGHRFYGITLVASNITLVYDMTDKMWAQWTDVDGNYWPIVATTYSSATGLILQHKTNGKLYTFDGQNWGDEGQPFSVELFTPNFDGGLRRRKQLNAMSFVADQVEGSMLEVRSNDWDYAATRWTNFRQVDLGVRKPALINNGTFMRRAYHFRHRSNTPFRLQAVELQVDIGTL